MKFALHVMHDFYNNVVSNIRLAEENGFQGLEFTLKNYGDTLM